MSDDFTPPHAFGYRQDTPDRRDRLLYQVVPNIDALPDEVNLESLLPGVYDQKVIGSCVGWSSATVAYTVMKKDGHRRPFMPSPVFLYREARDLGGYVEEDAGAEIRLAWKAMNKLGLPPMSNLKPRYNAGDLPDEQTAIFPEKSIWRKKPPASIYSDAETRQMLSYFRLDTLGDLLKCLADGYTANIGFSVYRSFYGPRGPVIDVPDPNPLVDRLLGGHAVTAYGYSKKRQRVFLRNQWGETAHENTPNFTLSFRYLENPQWSGDWWAGRVLEGGKAAA